LGPSIDSSRMRVLNVTFGMRIAMSLSDDDTLYLELF